jgi:hypothetical protein
VLVRQGPVIKYNQHELLAVRPYADKKIAAAIKNVIEVRSAPIKRAASPTIIPTKEVNFENIIEELLSLNIPREKMIEILNSVN